MKHFNDALYKSCKYSTETEITSGPETNQTITFIPNWCRIYAKRCKTTMVFCHKYEKELKTTGKLSGE